MTAQACDEDPRKWTIYRDSKGSPRWYQRWLEAWWIVNGSWSLHRAWQDGVFHGSAMEYKRVVINRGDSRDFPQSVAGRPLDHHED